MTENNIITNNISFSQIKEASKLFSTLQELCGSGNGIIAVAALYKLGVDQGKRIERARRAKS